MKKAGRKKITKTKPGESHGRLSAGDPVSIKELERAHILAILARSRNLKTAAKILGIDQATLFRKRKKYGTETD